MLFKAENPTCQHKDCPNECKGPWKELLEKGKIGLNLDLSVDCTRKYNHSCRWDAIIIIL